MFIFKKVKNQKEMNKLDNFINSLSNHELAIFFEYRYNGFLKNSKEKIDTEINRRNLSPEQLKLLKDKKLIIDSSEETKFCQRCGSDKLFVETDYKEIPVNEFSSAEIAVDSYRCRICGYNADKKAPDNFFERIIRIFKKNGTQRINRGNEI